MHTKSACKSQYSHSQLGMSSIRPAASNDSLEVTKSIKSGGGIIDVMQVRVCRALGLHDGGEGSATPVEPRN